MSKTGKTVSLMLFRPYNDNFYKLKEAGVKNQDLDGCSADVQELKKKLLQLYHSVKYRLSGRKIIGLSAKDIWKMIRKQDITEDKWREFLLFFIQEKNADDQ